jgi:two-component system sensor histidine kinase/response regulator
MGCRSSSIEDESSRFHDYDNKTLVLEQNETYSQVNQFMEGVVGVSTAQDESTTYMQSLPLKTQLLLYQQALAAADIGIWVWDTKTDQVMFDRTWKSMIGYSDRELDNDFSTWSNLVHPDDLEFAYQDVKDHVSGTTAKYQNVHRLRTKDGPYRFILDTGRMVSGTHICAGVHVDVHQHELNRMMAESAALSKQRLLSMSSHELRTPLNGILGGVNLVVTDESFLDLPQETQEMLSVIKDSGEHLLSIVNDILTISKYEDSTSIETKSDLFSIERLISQMERSTEALIEKHGKKGAVKFVVNNEVSLSGVECDKQLVVQIITNLVGNAVKFTESGHVRIRFWVEEVKEEEENDVRTFLRIDVEDSGIGMIQEESNQIFQPFKQANRNIQVKYKGTGLGLTITQHLAKALGGNVTVESTSGKGTIFRVKLRATFARLSRSLTISPFQPRITMESELCKSRNILYADDNKVNCLIFARMCRRLGATIKCFDDGATLLKWVENNGLDNIDLVVTDKQMPTDGKEVLRLLRDRVPVVLCTASAFREEVEHALREGFVHVITKPVMEHDLRQVFQSIWVGNAT